MNSDDQFDKRKKDTDELGQDHNQLEGEAAVSAPRPPLLEIINEIDPEAVRPELKELALKLRQSPNRSLLEEYCAAEGLLEKLDWLESRGYKRDLSPDNLSSIVFDLCCKIESGAIEPTVGIRDFRTIIHIIYPDTASLEFGADENIKALVELYYLSASEINLSDAEGMIPPEKFDSKLKVLNEKIIEAASVVLKNNSLKDQK
jgi:hypothetical protein